MKGYLKRDDDFEERRKKLANLSDEELKNRFWQLAEQVVEPLLKMAKENGVELRPIAYMAEGGKITVSGESLSAGKENTTKAYGYGSLIAYANKYEHKYKSNPDLAEPDKSTVSYGDIHIDGNIEAVDEWAADDAATKLEKYKFVTSGIITPTVVVFLLANPRATAFGR